MWYIDKLIENLLVHHNHKFFSSLRIILLCFGDYELEKVILNFSLLMEQEFCTTVRILKMLQAEVTSSASLVLGNHYALDTLTASKEELVRPSVKSVASM